MTSVANKLISAVKTRPAASFLFVVWFALAGCTETTSQHSFSGQTMGTSYNVKVVARDSNIPGTLEADIQNRLINLDSLLTTYQQLSELNSLNRAPLGEPQAISSELMAVLAVAKQAYQLSEGAFDPTVGPLVDLWGFGPDYRDDELPTVAAVANALQQVGFDHLRVEGQLSQATRNKDIRLDLSAVAKGYAADNIAALLSSYQLSNYLVEIGGELRLSGLNASNTPWRIAIESPDSQSQGAVQKIVQLSNVAVATSGDYRNYFEKDGKRYSHTIDPRTGYPIDHNLASVTVVADTAAFADAMATAFMVMGGEESLAMANKLNLPVYMLVKQGAAFEVVYSRAFAPYLSEIN